MNVKVVTQKLISLGFKDVKSFEKDGGIMFTGRNPKSLSINDNFIELNTREGKIDGKDVVINMSESKVQLTRIQLYELSPHPELIKEGMRVTIDHKSFGEISVIVTKLKRYDSSNALDGIYWKSTKKGIMGFASFDSIKRYYNPSSSGQGKDPKSWDNHADRARLGYVNESKTFEKFTHISNIDKVNKNTAFITDKDGVRLHKTPITMEDARFVIDEARTGNTGMLKEVLNESKVQHKAGSTVIDVEKNSDNNFTVTVNDDEDQKFTFGSFIEMNKFFISASDPENNNINSQVRRELWNAYNTGLDFKINELR